MDIETAVFARVPGLRLEVLWMVVRTGGARACAAAVRTCAAWKALQFALLRLLVARLGAVAVLHDKPYGKIHHILCGVLSYDEELFTALAKYFDRRRYVEAGIAVEAARGLVCIGMRVLRPVAADAWHDFRRRDDDAVTYMQAGVVMGVDTHTRFVTVLHGPSDGVATTDVAADECEPVLCRSSSEVCRFEAATVPHGYVIARGATSYRLVGPRINRVPIHMPNVLDLALGMGGGWEGVAARRACRH